MFAVTRLSLAAGALLLCGQLAGCASVAPLSAMSAAPAGSAAMSPAQMAQLGIKAEQALAANQLVEAGSSYVRIVRAYPDNATAWFRLGTIYLRTDQLDAAQMAFEQSLRADPNLSKAYANLALAHLQQFRRAATRALSSPQVAQANKAALRTLLVDVEHALAPPSALVPAARK